MAHTARPGRLTIVRPACARPQPAHGVVRLTVGLVMTFCFLLVAGAPKANADGLGYDGLPPQELCGLCHGLNGVSATARFPKLAGQKSAYIEKQLADFLEGRRQNDGGQMRNVITEISQDLYPEVARYFSNLPPPPPSTLDREPESGVLEAARELFHSGREGSGRAESAIPACASCHLSTNDALPYAPYLTAQHPGYIAKQLRDFRSGERANDTTGTMAAIAARLTDAEIDGLAAFLGTTPRGGLAHAD